MWMTVRLGSCFLCYPSCKTEEASFVNAVNGSDWMAVIRGTAITAKTIVLVTVCIIGGYGRYSGTKVSTMVAEYVPR